MIEVNLLPWRENEKQKNQQEFFTSLTIVLMVFLIIAGSIHFYLSHKIQQQEERNNYLTQQLTIYQNQIQEISNLKVYRQNLLDKINIIKNINATRSFVVKLFETTVKVIPDGLYITAIKRTDNQISIEGSAESNSRIATLIRQIDQSEILINPTLVKIDSKSGSNFRYTFSLKATVKEGALL